MSALARRRRDAPGHAPLEHGGRRHAPSANRPAASRRRSGAASSTPPRSCVLLGWLRGWRSARRDLAQRRSRRSGSRALCWAVMFTAFMVAITMTTVANVLVTMAIAPLVTALRRARRARPSPAGAHLGGGRRRRRRHRLDVRARGGGGRCAAPRRHRGRARRADRRGDQLDRDPARPAAAAADLLPAVLIGAVGFVPGDDRAAALPVHRHARTTWRCSACSASPSSRSRA